MKFKSSYIFKALTALVLALLMVFGTVATSMAAVVDDLADSGANADLAESGGTNWNANIFFRVPDSWNLSTYPNVQAWAVQSSSASSGTKYAFLLGNMSVAGTTSNSRLYHAWISANHSSWGTEYIAFTANTNNWGTGDFYISTSGQYTKPLNYGATNSSGAYLFSPSNASNNTASNNNEISGSYNGTNRDVLKKNQDFYVYTNGAASATGGKVKVTAYYVNGSSFNGSSAINSSSITVDGSDTGAHEQYGGAVEGTKVSLEATANTGYDFAGYYDAATGGNQLSSSTSYSYYVFGTKSVYARYTPKTYTITYNKGANGTGTVASTTKTHGVDATLSSSTFTRTGYTQDGWSTSDGGAKAYNLGGSYKTDAATTLYPHWTQNTYTVKKSETGGTGTVKVGSTTITTGGVSIAHGTYTVTVTAPTGYNVSAVSIGGTAQSITPGTSVTINSVSINAAKTIAVTYVSAGTCAFDPAKTRTTLTIGSSESIAVNPNSYHGSGTISASSDNACVTATYNSSTGKVDLTAVDDGSATVTISCTDSGSTSSTIAVTVSAPTVSFSDTTTATIAVDGTVKRTATPSSIGTGATGSVSYSGTNSYINVASDGTVTGLQPTSTAQTVTATYTVKVNGTTKATATATYKVSVSAPTFTVTGATIYANSKNTELTKTTSPSPSSISWSSSNSSYITVNSSGQVTAAAVPTSDQTATITATATYASGYTKTATCTVTLKAPTLVAESSKTSGYINDTATASVKSSSYPAVSSSTVSAYKWTTSDSSIIGISDATAAAPTLTFKKNGTATIKLEVTYKNTGLKKESANVSITVDAPSISVTGGTSFDVAKGEEKTLAATTSNPSGLTIKYSQSAAVTGFSVTEAGVVSVGKNAATNATYTVVATAYNSDNVAVKTQNITIKAVAPDYQIKNGDETLTSTSTVYMTTGGTKQLTLDKNYTGTFTFSSSDTSIVTVSDAGLLTAGSKKGTATITVTSTHNNPVNAVTGFIRGIFGLAESGLAPNETLTFNVNVTEADTYKYLYFTDGVGWSGVNAYFYGNNGNNANFPGEAMVKIGKNEENKDVYAIRYPATKNYTKVIISNSADNSKRVQLSGSSDLTLSSTQNAFWCNTANSDSGAGRWNCTIVKPQITANNVTIDMGSTQTMTATVLTSDTPSTFNWSSGTTSIATTADTHTASNVITGVAPGTSTITIKAYANKTSDFKSIVTDGKADDFVAGTTTATATVVAENKTVTFGAKKTDNGSDFSDLSGAVTAKYYDEDTSSGSGSSGGSGTATNYKVLYGDQTGLGSTSNATVYLVDGSYVANLSSDTTFLNALNSHTSNFYIAMSSSSSTSDIISITNANSVTLSGNMASVYGKDAQQRDFSGTKIFARIWRSGSTNVAGFKFTQSGSSYAFEISSSAISDGGSGSGSSGGESGGESSGTGYTGEGTTMTSPQSVPYGKIAVFTAQATYTSGSDTYAFAEWVDGSDNTLSTDLEYVVKITEAKTVYARYYKVFKLSAFDSYTSDGTNVTFATAPPKLITIKHGDDTYIYNYDGTADTGNPDSPAGDTSDKAAPLAIESGTYGQGNYIQYYAGDEITLYYSAMASSEIFKGVFYNNNANYFVKKPDAGQFVPHDYTAGKTLYMNSAYYNNVPSGLPTTTVDHDAHSIKFTGTQDYKNIDVELATKRKVYFSDYTNAIIGSKNTDDYYYDGEALSVIGDQLTVKAAGSATQTNSINKDNVKFYQADANGLPTGSALSGFTVTYDSGTDPITNSGATASTRYIIISGTMPSYDLYVDLGMSNSYTIKLGSKVISDPFASKTRLAEVADVTIKEGSTTKLTAPSDANVTSSSTSVATGTTLSLSSTFTGGWGTYYMFVGWYWGDDTAPDYEKGFISDKDSLNYTPKKGGTIWAVGTRSIYINGSKYITGKSTDWYGENNTQKNLRMEFDAESGRYYWEITDTMFASAGSNYKTWGTTDWNEKHTDYGVYAQSGDYYWTDNDDKYHGKSFFQIFDEESGSDHKTIWDSITSFKVDTPANGPTYGKVYPRDYNNDYSKKHDGQGFINFVETGSYAGQSSPLRIYYDPTKSGNDRLYVTSTKIYSNLYVSNGFNVGSTSRTSAVTVEPVVDGVVKTSGQTGYFSVGQQGTGWDPDCEGHVNHYKPQKKGATVRITKTAGGSDKIVAFFIYDITNKTVRAERNVKTATGNKYYIDLTLANEEQNLYIVPIVEEAGANVTISFDATQLNRAQWGDIVTAYAWYSGTGGNALGAYPGQPMIPSDDMTTWTTTFKGTNANNDELQGITFSNYVDGIHSWLGCSGVMSTVSYGGGGTAANPTIVTFADDGLIKQYNYIESGSGKEYSRGNFKAQTYDYREPIALYDRFKSSDNVSISFSMKDGNSSLLSWRHSELLSHNIVTLEPHPNWSKLNWEYLTNAKGDKYIDMNGNTLKTKPTASFYVAAKGQVMYDNSAMKYVFYSGTSFDSVSGVTYGGASGVNMNYAVQWYIYDASGNYITNVLTAGIADLSTNEVDSYIGKMLEDMGYAVDGKSVAVCYDKPRYMLGDTAKGAAGANDAVSYDNKGINVAGHEFDAYRFTGQWNAVASNELVKVNVGVGMMTDSGEVLANSNTAGYGNASASYDTTKGNNTRVTDEDGNEAPFTASDGSFVRTAVRDASNSPVKLNASSQNFIGWYYYDANTGDFVKANYASNENFYPNYSNKDVTFYAMYRASAIYQYKYTGREGARTYSASGEDLTAAEMGAHNVINPASHETDIKNKVPVGIGIFKKNIDFSPTNYNNWNKTADPNGYILDITGFNVDELPTYTLTAHYKNANGDLISISKTATYNTTPLDLTTEAYTTSDNSTKAAGTAPTTYYGQRFLGWYSYDGSTAGNLISTQANYGLRLTGNQSIIAVYDENSNALPNDGWNAEIDENEYNKELTTSNSGVYYNDTIVRIRYGSDVKATLPSGGRVGVIVIRDNKVTTASTAINGYNSTQLTQIANAVASGNTAKLKNGYSVTNLSTTNVTQFNRSDLAARSDYKNSLGSKYTVYAYVYDGSAYHFSAPSTVKTFE